jgi:amino acid adenylation domain-containing protein
MCLLSNSDKSNSVEAKSADHLRNAGLGGLFPCGGSQNSAATALIVDSRRYTYGELEVTARRWATRLAQLTPGGSKRIGIFAYRSFTTYAGVLATTFAGGTFVPLNPRFPAERTRDMVRQADLGAIIVDLASLPRLSIVLDGLPAGLPVLLTDGPRTAARFPITLDSNDLEQAFPEEGQPMVGSTDPAYLLFTSGSTGVPKGVPVTNGNVLSFMAHNRKRYSFSEADRFTQTFDHTFDLSIFDMFMAWSSGGTLCVPSLAQLRSPIAFVEEHGITVWFSVPSLASILIRQRYLSPNLMPRIRWSLFCGEALPQFVAEAWQAAAPGSVVENLYGPTELTICCAAHRWEPRISPAQCVNGIVPIGRVYEALSHVVRDQHSQAVTPGDVGELWIAGPQTFPGYWRADHLTADRIVEVSDSSGKTQHYYRTGDLVRQLPSGEYGYVGRMDTQIKINGYRVELGEIEAVLRQSGCSEAVALPWPDRNKTKAIIAFVTPDRPIREIGAFARSRLPTYMVPRRIEPVDVFPLNVNGKTDRGALGQLATAWRFRA